MAKTAHTDTGAFQYMAVLLNDKATGIRDDRREFGQIIVVRCVNSVDARTATPVDLPWEKLHRICERITANEGVLIGSPCAVFAG